MYISLVNIMNMLLKNLEHLALLKINLLKVLTLSLVNAINVKNKKYLISGEKIEDYIKNLTIFDDSTYNKCDICKNNINNYFCENCNKNICDICLNACLNDKHEIIDLKKEINDIIEYKESIKKFIIKEFIKKPEKKEKTLVKDQKSYKIIDPSKIIDDNIEGNFEIYTDDIMLILIIIEKNYNNFFHHKNIKGCFEYLKNKYKTFKKYIIDNIIDNESPFSGVEQVFVKAVKDENFFITPNSHFFRQTLTTLNFWSINFEKGKKVLEND